MASRPPSPDELLSREEFKRLVFERHQGVCAVCQKRPAEDAHHILDRKLFADGGYYLDNGVAVCSGCHWDCETTRLPVSSLLPLIGASAPRLPPSLRPGRDYDKWGNALREDGSRSPGPLIHDDGARKALAQGGALGLIYPEPGAF